MQNRVFLSSDPPPREGWIRRERGGGGLEPKRLCPKNGPNQNFRSYMSFFSHDEIWVQGGGGAPPPPRMATCEPSRVCCWWRRSQQNMQHMRIPRRREKPVKTRTRPGGAFRKTSVGKAPPPPPPHYSSGCQPL